MKSYGFVWSASLAFALGSCGPTPEQGCKDLFAVVETKLKSCGISYQQLTDNEDLAESCADLDTRVEVDKTVRYEGGQVSSCIEEVQNGPCDEQIFQRLARCARKVYSGTKAPGESCNAGAECQGGLCTATPLACPGICKAVGKAGTSCAVDTDCEEGLLCQLGVVGGTCVAPAGAGQKCGVAFGTCQAGLFCDTGGACQPRRGDGGACLFGNECQVTHRCVGAKFFPMMTNGSCTKWKQPMESCTVDDECAGGLSCEGGTCAQVVRVLGDACGPRAGHTRSASCKVGYCDSATKICTARVPVGGKCDPQRPCRAGSACIGNLCTQNACT